MTENTRTATYIGIALVLLIVAGIVNRKPAIETDDAPEVLFTALKSPDDVAGLEIVTADDGGRQTEFRVVRGANGWTLPLHNNYPADAEKEVASAAASLIDLKVLARVSTLRSEHAEYGVVDPENASPGASGVGKLVKVLDKSGNDLVRLVIGKQDTQAGDTMNSQELWFVRVLPHDPVYRVAMPSARFSTSFADWIETDLLKLDSWDISEVTLKDYTFDLAQSLTGQVVEQHDQLSTIELAFNDKDSKWALKKLVKFEKDKPVPVELGPDEELNSTRLNEMKTALDDLKIVDVHAKPAGMSANLKANKSIFTDRQTVQSLIDAGFYPVPDESGQPEILSSDGEVLVRMKDGLEYTLRFGGVAGIGDKEKDADSVTKGKEKEKSDGKAKADEATGTTLNRFIMVSARFNKDLVPKPELEALPEAGDGKRTEEKDEGKADATKAPEAKSESKEPASEATDKNKEADKSSGESAKSKDGAAPAAKDEDTSAAVKPAQALHFVALQDDPPEKKAATKDTARSDKTASGKATDTVKTPPAAKENEKTKAAVTDEKAKGDTAKSADEKTDDTAANDSQKADDAKKNDETKKEADDAKSDEKKSPAADQEKLALDRKRIEKENERKQKEYDDKIKKGEEKAAELNARFADWYYVVSEATYRKIHLNRDDVIKKKAEEKNTGAGADSTDNADDAAADALKIPPLTADPFKERDDAKKDEEKKNGEQKEGAKKDE
jgi:hypothetical protein